MTTDERIYIATMAVEKNMDFETLKYCDDLYGKEDQADEIWEYVEECREIGKIAFREMYKDYKFFHSF